MESGRPGMGKASSACVRTAREIRLTELPAATM
jgi:hypothetical protein